MIAVVPVRGGCLPAGADEAVAEAGGSVLVVGEGTEAAAKEIETARQAVTCAEVGPFSAGRWAAALTAPLGGHDLIVLPASPDGRDLAPRLAHAMGRPLLAGAVAVTPERAVLVRRGGLVAEEHPITGPAVATLEPGVRGFVPEEGRPAVLRLDLELPTDPVDAEVVEVVPPDPATMDLAEASRIVAGGAGLGGPGPFAALRRVAAALGAVWGASRVAADAGWVPADRFIGTTGICVSPRLYVAVGISGAVQHLSGLGNPDHVVAVNLDASAPMMSMAQLAIVSDAPAVLDELARLLGVADG